ncbi:MAG: hypothetical protein KJ964_06450 [Verrucomicrobia bacterium]|nr:hypothetical protein [Verrucomicrobiota bacterium]MBU1734395.1 hypothetical protein [Verrucomicrobiota bacterium]MBU1855683.1 hypothetical protein [Verrucomicrobiota bacterium]
MKRIVIGLLAVCLLGSLTALAEEKAVKKKDALQDITTAGKLAKHPMGFAVTEADGVVAKVIIKKATKEGETAVVNLEQFIGKDVVLIGMGTTKTNKSGKITKTIKTVTSIEEMAAPVAAAPAAAAPAAEAK